MIDEKRTTLSKLRKEKEKRREREDKEREKKRAEEGEKNQGVNVTKNKLMNLEVDFVKLAPKY